LRSSGVNTAKPSTAIPMKATSAMMIHRSVTFHSMNTMIRPVNSRTP